MTDFEEEARFTAAFEEDVLAEGFDDFFDDVFFVENVFAFWAFMPLGEEGEISFPDEESLYVLPDIFFFPVCMMPVFEK